MSISRCTRHDCSFQSFVSGLSELLLGDFGAVCSHQMGTVEVTRMSPTLADSGNAGRISSLGNTSVSPQKT